MPSPPASGPSGTPAGNASTVSVAGSFPNPANAREGASQPNSYNLNRYVYDRQGSVNDQLAQFMVVYKEEKPPGSK
ncbi:Ff.00g003630.m01.CDS01 [Fusarium sp. VM40]|nr:Ff.00g003630.m01.CDS01 [Fusarium sp. VM40]